MLPRTPARSRPVLSGAAGALALVLPLACSEAGRESGSAAGGEAASAAAGSSAETPRAPRTQNAILVSVDTLRPDHLSCYGYERPTSPHLDGLAQRGARFTDVTAAAPWTLPSHASLLTGLYPSHHGVKSHETRLPAEVVTLAEEFQAHGFETLAVVNTHNVGAPQYQLGQGFAHFEYITETDVDPRTQKLRTLNMGAVVVSSAQQLLAKRDPAKPFFLFLHFYDVHTDFTPSAEYRAEFVGAYDGKLDGRTQQLSGVRKRGERLGEADVRFLREMYDAEIRTFDELFGRFLAWLEEQGLIEDSLILVTSDHGEEFQEHGNVLHGLTHYQELLRVPLILAGPGVPAGLVLETPVHGVDVTPTLLAAMGIESKEARDGADLTVLWNGGTLAERALYGEADQDTRQAGHERFDTKTMCRRGRDKVIVDRVTGSRELYDLVSDPREQHNLSDARPYRARRLAEEMQRFLAGAVASEQIPPPSDEERARLDALGYGGGTDERTDERTDEK